MKLQLAAENNGQKAYCRDGKRGRKSDSVYQDLKRKIVTGELTSNCPITEQALAQEYGCSQSTIREALMQLQLNGLVVRRGYQGTFVTDPSILEAKLLLKLRIDIETAGIPGAVRSMTRDCLEELRDLDRQMDDCQARQDFFGCSELDREFHLKLFRSSGLSVLEPILVKTSLVLHRIMIPKAQLDSIWNFPGVPPHSSILDALQQRDVQAAAETLKNHILMIAAQSAPDIYGAEAGEHQGNFQTGPARILDTGSFRSQ